MHTEGFHMEGKKKEELSMRVGTGKWREMERFHLIFIAQSYSCLQRTQMMICHHCWIAAGSIDC